MRLSGFQWVVIVVLDVLLRVAAFVSLIVLLVVPIYGLMVLPFALSVSFCHLTLLVLVGAYIATWDLPPHKSAVTTLAVTNTLFAAAYVAGSAAWKANERSTECADGICTWFDGAITLVGVHALIQQTIIHLAVNIGVVMLAVALGGCCTARKTKHAMPLPQ
jgi:hypothetical protein